MFLRLGAFVSRFWPLVIVAWLGAAAGLRWAAPAWDDVTLDGNQAYLPDEMTSLRGRKLASLAFPDEQSQSQIVVVVEARQGRLHCSRHALAGDDAEIVDALCRRLGRALSAVDEAGGVADSPVIDVWSPLPPMPDARGPPARQLISGDERAALIVIRLKAEFMATANRKLLDRVAAELRDFQDREDFPRQRLALGVTGSAAVGADMLNASVESIRNTETATIILVLAILLVVYRAPMLAVIPLATIAASVMVATDVVALLTQLSAATGWFEFKTFKATKIFVVVILFGAGTDFCLFLISRYREELSRGLSRPDAVASALGHVGQALTASALTTVVGLGMMAFADFGKFRNCGPALALCLSVALLASVTLAPALLRLAGGIVFWPFGPPAPHEDSPRHSGRPGLMNRFWQGVGRGVVARPGLVLVCALFLLSPFAWHGYRAVKPNYDVLHELEPHRASVCGAQMVQRHFPAGYCSPLNVVVHAPGADFHQPLDQYNLVRLTQALKQIEGVKLVRSWATPLGEAEFSRGARARQVRREATDVFVSSAGAHDGAVARLAIVLDSDAFSPESLGRFSHIRSLLNRLSEGELPSEFAAFEHGVNGAPRLDPRPLQESWRGARFDFHGATAATSDLRDVTIGDQLRIEGLCIVAVYLVLLLILRRPVICAYLILSVVFSYLVALGGTELMFSLLYGADYQGLNWRVPLFLFVILVAIGEDYNIYLVTRVFEEQRRLGPLEGLREAIFRTGGIITSCGVIMAGTFLSMTFGTLLGMVQLGFALALGVLLDTLVVRPVLVPAFLALLYRQRVKQQAKQESHHDKAKPARRGKPSRLPVSS